MHGDFEHLSAVLRTINYMSDAEIAPILPHVNRIYFPKGSFLLKVGDIATHAHIVINGLLREFYTDLRGIEGTRSFSGDGTFSGSLFDLLSGKPAVSCVEALEPSVVLAIPWLQIVKISDKEMAWQILRRKIAESLYAQKVLREHAMLTMTAAENLNKFQLDNPNYLKRIPRQALASYLGITPVHLSRLLSANR